MTSDHGVHRDLAWALKQQSKRVGEQAPSVRGADWRLATVTATGSGTVTADGIEARCLETYMPTVGDVVVISQSSNGNWITLGRLSTTASTWTNLTLATGYVNPGHGYTAGWLREGRRVWLRGRIGRTGDAAIPNGATIATIPAALRPAGGVDVGWAVARNAGTSALVRVDVTRAGVLRTFESADPPTWISLDGITYLTD